MSSEAMITPRLTHFLVLAMAMLLIVLAAAFGGWTMLLLVCLCIASTGVLAFMSRRPTLFIVAMLAWEMFAFFSSNTYFTMFFMRYNILFRYVDDLLFLPPLILLAGHVVYHRRIEGRPVVVAAMVLVLVTVVTGLLHASEMESILKFVLMYYRYFVVFVFVATFGKTQPSGYAKVIKAVVVMLIIQCVINIFFAFSIPILPNRFLHQADDWAVGTMGLSSTMSYFALAALGIGVAGFGIRRQHEGRIRWSLMCLMALALVAVAHSKHAIVPAAAQLAVITLLAAKRHPVRSMMMMLVGVLLLAGIAETYNRFYKRKGQSIYEARALEMASRSKVRVYQNVAETLTKENAWGLGMGPGNYSSLIAMWNQSPLFMQHFYAEIYVARYNPRSSIMLYPRTGVLSFLGDTGIIGLLCYLAVLGTIVRRVMVNLAAGRYAASPEAHVLAIGWVGWVAFFLLLNAITDSLHYGLTPLLTFTWGGLVWNPPEPNETDETEAKPEESSNDSTSVYPKS